MSPGNGQVESRLTGRRVFSDPVLLLATGFGAGLAPRAPGTAGALVGLALYVLLQRLPLWGYLLAVAVCAVVGVWLCGRASARLGGHDHPAVVWDEVAGLLVTLCPAVAVAGGWLAAVAGFVLFRAFDIAKPWPIGALDRSLGGGLGIMADDLVAGACAGVLLWAGLRLIG